MTFKITLGSSMAPTADGWWTADTHYYRTEDGRIVPEGDLDAAWLWAAPGDVKPIDVAIKYGLVADPDSEHDEDDEDEGDAGDTGDGNVVTDPTVVDDDTPTETGTSDTEQGTDGSEAATDTESSTESTVDTPAEQEPAPVAKKTTSRKRRTPAANKMTTPAEDK